MYWTSGVAIKQLAVEGRNTLIYFSIVFILSLYTNFRYLCTHFCFIIFIPLPFCLIRKFLSISFHRQCLLYTYSLSPFRFVFSFIPKPSMKFHFNGLKIVKQKKFLTNINLKIIQENKKRNNSHPEILNDRRLLLSFWFHSH